MKRYIVEVKTTTGRKFEVVAETRADAMKIATAQIEDNEKVVACYGKPQRMRIK